MRMHKVIALSIVLCLVMSLAPLCAATAAFGDVPEGSWYKEPVQYCAERELMLGTGEHTFSPKTEMNRAMFVTVLYRIEQKLHQSAPTEPKKNEPTPMPPTQPTAPTADPTTPSAPPAPSPAPTEPKPTVTFSDVKQGAYYAEALAWAVENGIVHGYPDGTFHPGGTILRQDAACMIVRYVKASDPILLTYAVIDLEPLDLYVASEYAREDIYKVTDLYVMLGDKDGMFRPKGILNRAEAASLLMRLYQRRARETFWPPLDWPMD